MIIKVAYIGVKGIPARGGAERVVEALASRAIQHEIIPTVYCDRAYTPVTYTPQGIEIIRLPTISGKYLRSTVFDLVAGIHAVLFGHYDLIHLHNVEASFILPLLKIRYPVITTSHGSAYWRAKWGGVSKAIIKLMDIPFVKLSNEVTFVSAKDAAFFEEKYGRDTRYIPNGVGIEYTPDTDRATELLREHSLAPNSYFVFVAGRIEPTKGAHLAIEAVNKIVPQEYLLVIGDYSHKTDYSNQLRLIAGDNIKFHPLIDNAEILFGIMVNAKALVFPSTVEAMSMVLLEAASLGVPVICSDIEENRTVMGENSVYFKSGDVNSLKEQLRWVSANPNEVQKIAQKAMYHIRESYSWDIITKNYINLYNKALNQL